MPQERKHPSHDGRPAAERPFVDREELIAVFHAALKQPQRTEPLVLVFHGGAGIGKSRLRRELARLVGSRQQAVDRGIVTATLDFNNPTYRQPDTALLALRKAFGEASQIRFPSFDIAYAFYWQKTHPDAPLASGDMTGIAAIPDRVPKEAELGSLLSQLLDESGKLPLIGLIPKVSALVGSRQQTADREWWKRRGERELEDIPQMEPAAIVECLPKLWASDLKDYLGAASRKPQATSREEGGKRREESQVRDDERGTMNKERAPRRAVLFIDSYEKLGGTTDEGRGTDLGQKTDAWVRELVKQLPEVLWVICGRQKLRWEEAEADWGKALHQHLVEALADSAARQLLASCEIADPQTQDAIVKGSQGVPHYLNLAVDTFQEIKQSGQRVPSASTSQAGTPEELFGQFIRHLDQPEIETLQVLSASRVWNYGLFEHLVTEYQTGYPLTGYDDLSRFSFVGEGAAPETRTMHELMREALQEHQAPELRKRVHLFLHELYAGQLKGLDVKGITEKHRTALVEAFYHGREAMSAQEVWAWLEAAARVFREAEQARVLLPLYREMTQALETELEPNHAEVATALWRLSDQFYGLGEYDEAEPLVRRALAIAETGQGPEHPRYGDFLHLLALLLKERGRFDEAEALLRRLVRVRENEPRKDAETRVSALHDLATVLTHQSKYGEAEEVFRRGLAVSESELGPDHVVTAHALNQLGLLLFEQGRFADTESLLRRALAIDERTWGTKHPKTVLALANLAVDLKRSGRYGEAEPLLRQALKLCEETLGPDHARTALAANNLAGLLLGTGRYAEAEPLFRRALAAFERKAGPDHPYMTRITCSLVRTLAELGKDAEAEQMALSLVANLEKTRGRDHPETADALYSAGKAYCLQKRHAEGKSYLARALEIRTKALGTEHPNTLASLGWLAGAEEGQGNYAEAERLYRDLLAKQERVLGPEHPGVAETANAFAGICSRDGRYEEAETLYRRALAIREKVFGQDHPFVAEVLEGLAKVCEQTGRAAEAKELSARANRIRAQAESKAPQPRQPR